MARYTYPAIFSRQADGGFYIYFPDIESLRVGPNDFARLVSCDTALYRSQMQAVAPLALA